jgi:hypothetical protein
MPAPSEDLPELGGLLDAANGGAAIDFEVFSRCAAALAPLHTTTIVQRTIHAELARVVADGDYIPEAIQEQELSLLERNGLSLQVSFLAPGTAAPTQLFGAPHHVAIAVLSPSEGPPPLVIERYRLPPPFRVDILDTTKTLEALGPLVLAAGAAHAFRAGADLFCLIRVSRPCALLTLRSGLVDRIRWVFDAATLRPTMAIAADRASSRIEFACHILAELGAASSVPTLKRLAGSHPDHFVRWTALDSLVRVAPAAAEESLRAALDDPHPHLREVAARAIGRPT